MLFYLFSHQIQVDVRQRTFSLQNGLSQTQGPFECSDFRERGFLSRIYFLISIYYAFSISS